ncbi:MAG: DUF6456 domain-containing protein [Roseovarius sp.]|uniref:DUF6456 domain-containing protein n=1 Tax=Roseovarius sp. TaxID=1486281 RepID=UPI0040582951
MPGWVPHGALHYLAHTETGAPIRALARQAGCHASTIMRQIRRIETRRDDPLVDAALRRLGAVRRALDCTAGPPAGKTATMTNPATPLLDEDTFAAEALRVLRRLHETGAILAVAEGMEKAIVLRETDTGPGARTAAVDSAVAQAMALKDWIAPGSTGRVTRYHITSAGRAALRRMIEDQGAGAHGFAEDQTAFLGMASGPEAEEGADTDVAPRRGRYCLSESPLSALARRRDKSGAPFLNEGLVHAGERLREDFELAQMGGEVTQNWDHFLTPGAKPSGRREGSGSMAAAEARKRVAGAMAELGPGLSDVVLRCCCYLEGLETTEKRLGWSARSGKIVLRIALMRLKRHYDETVGPGGPMIG